MIKLLVYGFLGYVVYAQFFKGNGELVPNDSVVFDPEGETTQSLLTQPQQRYPYEKAYDPRVDNADQPWYVDSRAFMGREDLKFFSSAQERDSNIMSYNTNEFWKEISSKYTVH